jgi:two-component system nitrate/nitrite response regulator NarL
MQGTLFAVIADSRTLFRQGLASLLVSSGVAAVAEAADQAELLRVCRQREPHVILLAANMLQLEGRPNAIEQARVCCPCAMVVVIGEAGAAPIAEGEAVLELRRRDEKATALDLGADAYVCAAVDFEVLRRVVRSLGEAERSSLRNPHGSAPQEETGQPGLHRAVTDRERAILALISVGMSNKEIAARLDIHTQTVKNHVSHLLEKLGFADRTQLAVYAVENGMRYSCWHESDGGSGC